MLSDPEHKKIYATGGRTKVPVYVTGVIKIDNAKIQVLESDSVEETQNKYVYFNCVYNSTFFRWLWFKKKYDLLLGLIYLERTTWRCQQTIFKSWGCLFSWQLHFKTRSILTKHWWSWDMNLELNIFLLWGILASSLRLHWSFSFTISIFMFLVKIIS